MGVQSNFAKMDTPVLTHFTLQHECNLWVGEGRYMPPSPNIFFYLRPVFFGY